MDGRQRRHRSSTAASRSYNPNNPHIDQLQSLFQALSKSSASPRPTIESIQNQCDVLRRIRQALIDSANPTQAKDAFRYASGFNGLLDAVRSVSGYYDPGTLSAEENAAFFELLGAILDVLSEASNEHSGNRRYFAKKVDGGGWKALEQALASTGIGAGHFNDALDHSGQEQLFGSLIAFALGEDSIRPVFRGISTVMNIASETIESVVAPDHITPRAGADEISSVAESEGAWIRHLENRIRRILSGKEILLNPDMIPIVFNLWKAMSNENSATDSRNPFAISVLLAIRDIISMSVHNKNAVHGTGLLSTMLPMVFTESRHVTEHAILKSISELLIRYGVNDLKDAYFLYQKAGESDEAGDFLLEAMRASREPPFMQFDLSLQGYSSLELKDLGRPFPPTSSAGYTIAAWIRIDRFDESCHTTIFGACDSTQQCFVLAYLEKGTKHFILQTSVSTPKPSVRFRFNAFHEGRWYHVAIVHRRPKAMSSSKAALFINGEFTEQIKCAYPISPPAMSTSTESFASISSNSQKLSPVQAFLGTPQDLAARLGRNVVISRLDVATFHIFSEALSDEIVHVYQKMGPRYSGNYQDTLGSFQTYRTSAELNVYNEMLHPGKEEKSEIVQAVRGKASTVLPESQILFSISPTSVMDDDDRNNIDESQLIRSLSKDAAKSLFQYARIGGNSIIINAAVPSINDALTQPRGVALLLGDPIVIVPQALDDASWRIGGCTAVGLKLVELAQSKDAILRAVNILLESVEFSWRNSEIMEKESGFAGLGSLLREKLGLGNITSTNTRSSTPLDGRDRDELSYELLKVILRFVGYVKTRPVESLIINPLAYRILLVDADLWRRSAIETQKLYYQQFVHFAEDSKNKTFNQRRLTRTRIVKRLLDALKAESLCLEVLPEFKAAFVALLKCCLIPENLRSVALFITYSLQDSRTLVSRSLSKQRSVAVPSNRTTTSNASPSGGTPRSGSPLQNGSPALSRFEIGVKVLEIFTDLLCDPVSTYSITRFARTITNKWLLYLLAENESRVIVFGYKILARLLVTNGPTYVKKFSEKTGGVWILRQRLRIWWNIPSVWVISLAILFGLDISKVDLERKFDLFNLSELFSPAEKVQIVYPEFIPVVGALLETGLRTVVKDPNHGGQNPTGSVSESLAIESESSNTRKRSMSLLQEIAAHGRSRSLSTGRMTGYASILHTVIQYLTELNSKSPSYQEFAITSNYVQELLFVLYPLVVTSDTVSAETELHSRGSALTFEGHDVVIQPHSKLTKEQHAVVRTAVVQSPPSPAARTAVPLRRGSSFILVSSDNLKGRTSSPRLRPLMSPEKSNTKALQVGSAVVEGLLELILGVFSVQLFRRKDFVGFGLFLKVPPGFQEHQAYFESYVLLHAMSSISNSLQLDQKLFCEPRVLINLSKYCSYMAEAVFEGWFLSGAEPLLDFIGNLLDFLQRPDIAALKSVRLCNQAIANIRAVFLRVVLLKLSDVDESEMETETSSFLEKMIYWQTIILSPDNSEVYFLRLMCYLLFTKLISQKQAVREAAANFWRLLLVQKPEETSAVFINAPVINEKHLSDGFAQLTQLDNDTFLEWLDKHRADLNEFFFGTIAKAWEDFVDEENRKTEESAKSRVNKRRERLRQWHTEQTKSDEVWHRHEISTTHWRANIHSSERLKHQRTVQDNQDNLGFIASRLEKLAQTLQAPCGLFGTKPQSKWQLDETEGRNRMRMRILPDTGQVQEEYQPKRKTSEATPNRNLKVDVTIPRVSTSPSAIDTTPSGTKSQMKDVDQNSKDSSTPAENATEEDDDFEMVDDINEGENGFEDKNRKVMRSLQMGDQVQHVSNVSRIVGLEACEGLLIIGNDWLYLLDNFFQRSDGEIVRVWQAPKEERDNYVQMISGREASSSSQGSQYNSGEHATRNWRWSELISISKRRFLFRDVGLEIFFGDGRSYLLTGVSTSVRNDLYNKLSARAPHIHNPSSIAQLEGSWRLDALRNPEEAPQTFGSKFANVFNPSAMFPATKRWLKGEISNFHYLMLVNTLAGRTFNDLTQYPVFPWVLADYTSEELDLTNPRSFRDLSKPMGCQSASREAEFRDRYQSFAEMGDHNAPPFHYGTHYSSAMIVTSYLIRLQPFVQSYLLLQGGSFDHADRMFYSIEKAWLSASKDNMTDVRELTPEFFYLPEFLTNINCYNFGTRQGTGAKIDNVVLPPWAKGDPHIFITKHREALESPFVSKNLHHWIDLVFGFKQRGEAAIEATNVFHHLSYQGAKDLDNIEDPLERLATIGIIHNFGQTPHQIFSRSHVPRDDISPKFKRLDNAAESLTRLPFPLLESHERVASLLFSQKQDRLLCSAAFRINIPPLYERYMEWGFTDDSVRFYATDNRKLLGLFEHLHQGQISSAIFLDSRIMITAGADCTLSAWTMTMFAKAVDLQPKVTFFGHKAPVITLATSRALSTFLSADTAGHVYLWDLNRSEFIREIGDPRANERDGPVQAARISSITGHIILCRGPLLQLYTLNGHLLLSENVCETDDPEDIITSCAVYEGVGNEWVSRELIFTGHKRGLVNIFTPTPTPFDHPGTKLWSLTPIKRLNHTDSSREDRTNFHAAISCILPMAQVVYTGDEDGRVVSYPISMYSGGDDDGDDAGCFRRGKVSAHGSSEEGVSRERKERWGWWGVGKRVITV
ncbi:beach-domain-containing protein [Pseudovirgaria hyperparasitica]|uniref:Beach-domain-containing protein n=1 Tax=Pseudovirgaria hyperparasitica TaxID=470096 RepID=A0A6A6W8H7_9PEZI|nr:beach-domain-containing protein [Pseudovirgaria hyperparasitica]KAF2758334.1 beach-domain-containing protein [Pseudovirgaria hyperparasitica]